MAVDLTKYVKALEVLTKDPRILQVGATAMVDEMKRATARYIGSDLRLSGFRGAAVEFATENKAGQAVVQIKGGTYAIADSGRHSSGRIRSRRARALRTPWGPKSSVRGSTWAGFGITDKHVPDAYDAGAKAIIAELESEAF